MGMKRKMSRLSMKHYACPLEGVQELEEREASLKNQAGTAFGLKNLRACHRTRLKIDEVGLLSGLEALG